MPAQSTVFAARGGGGCPAPLPGWPAPSCDPRQLWLRVTAGAPTAADDAGAARGITGAAVCVFAPNDGRLEADARSPDSSAASLAPVCDDRLGPAWLEAELR